MQYLPLIQFHTYIIYTLGKSQKKKINQPDNGFDIATALRQRKPLRKISTAINLEGQHVVI